MRSPLRRPLLLLCWLLLALLPLRGWAHLVMHLPAQESATAAPCHGAEAAGPVESSRDPAQPCTLCDVCHGAMLIAAEVAPGSDRPTQPLPSAGAAPAADAEPDALFKPPRR